MKERKKNYKTFHENRMFSKGEFYVKTSLIILIATIFTVIFVLQNGRMFFEIYPYAEKFRNYDFQLHIIDVGNGDAMLIKFPNDETMMIDTGEEYYSNKVTSYVQQYLWSEGLNQIDYLVLTHPDSDHVGGANKILDKFKVKNVYRPKIYSMTEYEILVDKGNYKINDSNIYDKAIMKAYEKKCNIFYNEAGISFKMGDCSVEFLAPLLTNYSESNNYSAVIMITYQSKKFLFMGDAETIVEEQLIEKYGDYLKADVLKAGHHGSYSSSSEEFLNVVNPEYVLFSSSGSKYFPHEDVVERVNNLNSKMLATAVRGSFEITVVNKEIICANADKPKNNLAIVFTIFLISIFIIWENPFKKIKPMINRIKND